MTALSCFSFKDDDETEQLMIAENVARSSTEDNNEDDDDDDKRETEGKLKKLQSFLSIHHKLIDFTFEEVIPVIKDFSTRQSHNELLNYFDMIKTLPFPVQQELMKGRPFPTF
jgi:hypothetical protein